MIVPPIAVAAPVAVVAVPSPIGVVVAMVVPVSHVVGAAVPIVIVPAVAVMIVMGATGEQGERDQAG
jgi:hypothetical protein